MHCNYISNTWKLLLHNEKLPSLNREEKFLKQVTLFINGKLQSIFLAQHYFCVLHKHINRQKLDFVVDVV